MTKQNTGITSYDERRKESMKQTRKQMTNCLNVMLETINRKSTAIDILVTGDCIEEAVNIATDMAREASNVKTMLMEFDLNS